MPEKAQQQLGPVETAVLATLGLVGQSVMKALYAAVEDEEITKQHGMILSVRFQTEVDAAFEKVHEAASKVQVRDFLDGKREDAPGIITPGFILT